MTWTSSPPTWIRALDRLPEPGQQVLVRYPSAEDDVAVLIYDPQEELDWTHWLPVPPGPDADEEEEQLIERQAIDALERQARMLRDNLRPR